MPFSPVGSYTRYSRVRESGSGRTNEAACRVFGGFGAPADIAYSFDIVSRKAKLITLKHDEAVLDPEVQ